MVDGSRETIPSRHSRTDWCTCELTEIALIRHVHIQARKHPNMKKGKWAENPTHKWETICNWYLMGKDSFLQLVNQPHSTENSRSRKSWPTQDWLQAFYVLFILFNLVFLLKFWFCLFLLFSFSVCTQERGHIIGSVGMLECSRRGFQEKESDQNIAYKKVSRQ